MALTLCLDRASEGMMSTLLEETLAEVYRRVGFTIRREVGLAPGTIVWTASSIEGTKRSTVLFRGFASAPIDHEQVLRELGEARIAIGADEAVGIVFDPAWSPKVEGDVHKRFDVERVTLMSFRSWLLQIIGVDRYIQEFMDRYERSGLHELHFSRTARINGEEVDAGTFLENWVMLGDSARLSIVGVGKTYELLHAAYQICRCYERAPEQVIPAVFVEYQYHSLDGFEFPEELPRGLLDEAFKRGFVVAIMPDDAEGFARRALIETEHDEQSSSSVEMPVLALVMPSPRAMAEWIKEKVGSAGVAAAFRSAVRANADFATLSGDLRSVPVLLRAIRKYGKPEPALSINRWIVEVMGEYVDDVLNEYCHEDPKVALAKGAYEYHRWGETGTLMFASGMLSRASQLWGIDKGHIEFSIVEDYLIGFHVANTAMFNDFSALFDGPLPRFALHTVAVLVPEVAADLTLDQVERMEEGIEHEVARRLQLTFAHILNRPVGMLRQCVQDIREGIDDVALKRLAANFDDVEKQLTHLADLAQKIKLWQETPEGSAEDVALLPLVTKVTRMLGERYSGVRVQAEIDPSILVHVLDHAFHEILYNIVENAFHAALDGMCEVREVKIQARVLRDVIIVEIEDSGDGIVPAAREKIFDLFHTTKKGGRGKPRGTGLGLAIVRKYVRAFGGRVELLSNRERTTFAIELIGHRRNP